MKARAFTQLFLMFLTSSWPDATALAQQRAPAPVAVIEAVKREVAAGQTFVATVRPLKRVVVGSAVDGRVVELAVHVGDRVEKQQPLVRMLTASVELELAAAEAELELHKQQLAELEHGSRPNEIEQANARMLAANIRMLYAQGRRDRLDRLNKSRAVSQGDYDQALASAAESEHGYLDLKAAHELAVAGPRPEKLAQARAHVAIQQALINRIRDRIKKYTVKARFAGYVVVELTEEGAWLQSGDPVMEVVALDEVEVEAFIPELNVPHIVLGMSVRVEVPSVANRVFTGVVTKIVPQADTRARTFPVRIRVVNEINESGPLLKSGMYARVELPTGSAQQAIMVPKDALVLGGPQPTIFVVDKKEDGHGTVVSVPVELGVAITNLIQVKGSISPGQLVVVEGNERLRPGQNVVISRVAPLNMPTAASK